MEIKFYKYQGAGNDFVMLDNRDGKYSNLTKTQIELLCDRRFGVGADGLIKLELEEGYDFKMRYYNADGGEAEMCGNGARCIVQFARQMGIQAEQVKFLAMDGEHQAKLTSLGVAVHMSDVQEVEQGNDFFYLNTGVPHYVKFVENLAELDVVAEGRAVRYSERFKEVGTNVNFIELTGDKFSIRTYERGVEDETLACGTGCTAAAIASFLHEQKHKCFDIQAKGGKLKVYFESSEAGYQDIWKEGPAELVFAGSLTL